MKKIVLSELILIEKKCIADIKKKILFFLLHRDESVKNHTLQNMCLGHFGDFLFIYLFKYFYVFM